MLRVVITIIRGLTMRKLLLLLSVAALSVAGWAQQNAANGPTAPQTARQALMEMFFSKTPGTFAKHLPAATRAALDKSGALASMQQYSLMLTQLETQGQNLQTFETGSVLLTAEDPKTGVKADITVENDALRGDTDDIELTFHMSKNGQEQPSPFRSLITFTMKQEAQLWTLNEISVTIHVPLADPGFLKIISEKMKPQVVVSGSSTPITARPEVSGQPAGSDAMVVAAMRTIITAEITYSSSYPAVGFTCSLSSLDGFGGGERNEHQAMLINSGLASGKRYGYVFSLSECGGTPAASFHLTAVPNGNSYGRKAFCADQSGAIRSSIDGSAANCLASGVPVQ
jgi:type IV pilus assembly protein PilA